MDDLTIYVYKSEKSAKKSHTMLESLDYKFTSLKTKMLAINVSTNFDSLIGQKVGIGKAASNAPF